MKFKPLILAVLLILSLGCNTFKKVQAPAANANAKADTQNLMTLFQNFYSNLTGSSDKSYATHAGDYAAPNAAIRSLAVEDSARKHSTALMIIVHDTENRFHTYQAEHANIGTPNNSQILAFREGMDALMDILVRTENHYK